MYQNLIASGFGAEEWNGTYIQQYNTLNSTCDLWKYTAPSGNEYYIFINFHRKFLKLNNNRQKN